MARFFLSAAALAAIFVAASASPMRRMQVRRAYLSYLIVCASMEV